MSFQIQDADFNVGSTYKIYTVFTTHSVLYTHTCVSLNESTTCQSNYLPNVPNMSYIATNNFTVTVYYNGPYIVNILYRV